MRALRLRVAAALVCFSGCVASFTNAPPMPAAEVLHKVQLRDAAIHSLEAEGTLTIESPKASGTAAFELQLKAPDSLWVRFSGPFGISVGTLALSRERFAFYNARENRLLTGVPEEATLERVFHVALSFDEIISAVKGALREMAGADSLPDVSVVEDRYFLEMKATAGKREFWVDGTSFVTTNCSRFDETGRPLLTAAASRIEIVDGIPMPHLIRVILPGQRQSATIAYSEVDINGVLTKQFSLPENVREINIGGGRRDRKYE